VSFPIGIPQLRYQWGVSGTGVRILKMVDQRDLQNGATLWV